MEKTIQKTKNRFKQWLKQRFGVSQAEFWVVNKSGDWVLTPHFHIHNGGKL